MIINKDCLVAMKSMECDSMDVVFTSPPYNRKRNDKYNKYTDQIDDYYIFLCNVIDECLRVCKGNVFFNIQQTSYNRKDVHRVMGRYADEIIDNVIWNKSNPMPSRMITNAYEYIIVMSKNNKSLMSNSTYTLNQFTTTVFSDNPYKETHRAVMHPDACRYIVENFTKEGDLILDPFFGTGTTGEVCVKFNRPFIGIELSPEYCEIARKRVQEAKDSMGLFGGIK